MFNWLYIKQFFLATVCCLLLALQYSIAQVKLPQLIRDSMVLQRDCKIKIWGWAAKNEKVTVKFNGKSLRTTTDADYIPSESQWAELREAQLKSLSVSGTGMAVAIYLGEWNNIHPDNKKDVGERLALIAEKIASGENIVYSGSTYQSSKTEGNKIIISFNNVGSGLITNDGEQPGEFAIAGADKKFVWAKTKIEGYKIIVWNDEIPGPMYVRYAWADNPVNPNLYNKEGLPASPFRTDK